MPFLRIVRDRRGYEYFYLVQPLPARRGRARQRLLYWFRTPPDIKVGRIPLDDEVRRALEKLHPDVTFDWESLRSTPLPPPSSEPWRERRRLERLARQSRESDDSLEAPPPEESPGPAALPAPAAALQDPSGRPAPEDLDPPADLPMEMAEHADLVEVEPPAGALSSAPAADVVTRRRRRRRRGRRSGSTTPSGTPGAAEGSPEGVHSTPPEGQTEDQRDTSSANEGDGDERDG